MDVSKMRGLRAAALMGTVALFTSAAQPPFPSVAPMLHATSRLPAAQLITLTLAVLALSAAGIVEGRTYIGELSGRPKEKESLWGLIRGVCSVLRSHLGTVHVNLGAPIEGVAVASPRSTLVILSAGVSLKK